MRRPNWHFKESGQSDTKANPNYCQCLRARKYCTAVVGHSVSRTGNGQWIQTIYRCCCGDKRGRKNAGADLMAFTQHFSLGIVQLAGDLSEIPRKNSSKMKMCLKRHCLATCCTVPLSVIVMQWRCCPGRADCVGEAMSLPGHSRCSGKHGKSILAARGWAVGVGSRRQ